MGSDDEIGWQPRPVRAKQKLPDTNTNVNNYNSMLNDNRQFAVHPFTQPNISPTNKIPIQNYDYNNNASMQPINTYQVTLNGDKRIITASTLDEIIKNIRIKYNLLATHQMRVNYWSDEYREWVFLDSYPPDKAKLQVILMDSSEPKRPSFLIKSEEELNQYIRNEMNRYLDQPLNFSKHMNLTLKYYVESNKPEILNYFEQSVHYIQKRHSQNHNSPSKEILHIQQQHQCIINQLQEESQILRQENRTLRQQIDEIRKELDNLETQFKRKKTPSVNGGRSRCSVM